jgi:putative transposase
MNGIYVKNIAISINIVMRNKAFTVRLNPTEIQLEQLRQSAGVTRWLWNYMLNANITRYEKEKKFIFQFDMNGMLPALKSEFEWIGDANSQVLQQKCRDLDIALKAVSRKKNPAGFPKFKAKHKNNDSFRVPQHFKLSNKGVKLPKMGWISWNPHRKFQGKAKSITIKQELDQWYAVVLCELPDVETRSSFSETEVVGIDVGIKDFAVLSTSEKIKNPNHFKKSETLLKKKQRKLSKKVKNSLQYTKQRSKVAKLHRHIANQRNDFQWKLANSITKNYSVICLESLNIKGMVKNRKLSKAISNAGWFNFKLKLNQKAADVGGVVVNINRFAPSSKMCGSCGTLNTTLTLKDREWDCDCGVHHDRDINAANNIKTFGIDELNRLGTSRIYACGDTANGDRAYGQSSYVSLKHENLVIGPETHKSLVCG